MNPLFRSVVCAAAALFVPIAAAQDIRPDALVKSVTEQVIAVVKQDQDIQAGNKRKTIAFVEQKVLPHFDFARMTALATGVNWRKATPEQQRSSSSSSGRCSCAPIRRRCRRIAIRSSTSGPSADGRPTPRSSCARR